MDRVMPIDLENAKLGKVLRGYDPAEVDRLLAAAAAALERELTEKACLKETIDHLRSELEMFKREEKFVQEALVTAQKTADEIRAAAQKHADLIVEEARQLANTERTAAQQRVTEFRWELEKLRQDRQRFIEDFRLLLERAQRELAGVPTFEVVDSASA
ncbi:MAG TPA: DivIVA domain-containing protein [Fimbriimonas sp.]|nr:DivIVA domain-containing protein [Fimbriimonas sp.]